MEKGRGEGAENTIITALAARFGSVSDQLSERIHSFRERNSALLDELIKLAVTAQDIGDFERKLDKMGWGASVGDVPKPGVPCPAVSRHIRGQSPFRPTCGGARRDFGESAAVCNCSGILRTATN